MCHGAKADGFDTAGCARERGMVYVEAVKDQAAGCLYEGQAGRDEAAWKHEHWLSQGPNLPVLCASRFPSPPQLPPSMAQHLLGRAGVASSWSCLYEGSMNLSEDTFLPLLGNVLANCHSEPPLPSAGR